MLLDAAEFDPDAVFVKIPEAETCAEVVRVDACCEETPGLEFARLENCCVLFSIVELESDVPGRVSVTVLKVEI